MLKKIIPIIQKRGINGLLQVILEHFYIRKAQHFSMIKKIVSCGNGLKIGGPSLVFQKKNILPIYNHINCLDNCNFSHRIVWEGGINKGLTYDYSKQHDPGQQFLLEATDLHILVIAQKPPKDIIPDNRSLSDYFHSYKWETPFTSDKI